MKGRKPTSHDLKLLKGTASKARKFAKPKPAGRWTAPSWVGKWGAQWHRKHFPLALETGALSELDRDTWFVLAQTYDTIRRCYEQLEVDGLTISDSRGAIKKHPSTSVLNQLMTHYRALVSQFGLDPTGRERLGLSVSNKPKSKMESLID